MTQDRSRQIGRALMALAVLQFLWFLVGALRRSYLVVALPAGLISAALAGLGVWVGYTMATTNWDNPADWPPSED